MSFLDILLHFDRRQVDKVHWCYFNPTNYSNNYSSTLWKLSQKLGWTRSKLVTFKEFLGRKIKKKESMSIQHPFDSCFFFHAFPPTICFFRITRGVEIFAAFSYCSGPVVYWHRANEARLVSSMRSQHESPTSFYITRYSKTSVKRGVLFQRLSFDRANASL